MGAVQVTKGSRYGDSPGPGFGYGGGAEWLVTFLGPRDEAVSNVGDQPLLEAVASGMLTGTQASVTVEEEVRGSRLGGVFALEFGEWKSEPLPFDASADQMRRAVQALLSAAADPTLDGAVDTHVVGAAPKDPPSNRPDARAHARVGRASGSGAAAFASKAAGRARVTRSALGAGSGHRWAVTFGLGGDLALLRVDGSLLEGSDASARALELRPGTAPAAGHFRLGLGGAFAEERLAPDAPAEAVKRALESLEGVGDVVVSATEIDLALHAASASVAASGSAAAYPSFSGETVVRQRRWDVTFTGLGASQDRLGDMRELVAVDDAFLTGTLAGLEARELRAGCCDLDLSFNGGADWTDASSLPLRFDPRAVVEAADPPSGPAAGGTLVTLHGAGFLPNADGRCAFGPAFGPTLAAPGPTGAAPQPVPAVWLSPTAVACRAPPLPAWQRGLFQQQVGDAVSAPVVVTYEQLSLDGASLSRAESAAFFTYETGAQLRRLSPAHGPTRGRTNVTVYGAHFVARPPLACRFRVSLESNVTLAGERALEATVPAVWHNASAISCLSPDLLPALFMGDDSAQSKDANGDPFDDSPEAADWGSAQNVTATADISVTSNGVDFTPASLRFAMLPTPSVRAVTPRGGPRTGGTSVTVTGENFVPSEELACRFGESVGLWDPERPSPDDPSEATLALNAMNNVPTFERSATVPAAWLSPTKVVCAAPRHDGVQSVQRVTARAAAVAHSVQRVELRRLVSEAEEEVPVLGNFTLELEGYTTVGLNASATEAQVERALAELPPLGSGLGWGSAAAQGAVRVNRTQFEEPVWVEGELWGVTSWEVSFLGRGGALEAMTADDSELQGLGVGGGVTVATLVEGSSGPAQPMIQTLRTAQAPMQAEVQAVTVAAPSAVTEVQEIWLSGAAALNGSFVVSYSAGSAQPSPPLSWDASAAEVAAAVMTLPGSGDVKVTRFPSGVRGFSWHVTFASLDFGFGGERPLLAATGTGLQAAGKAEVSLTVRRTVVGQRGLGGTFRLRARPLDAYARRFDSDLNPRHSVHAGHAYAGDLWPWGADGGGGDDDTGARFAAASDADSSEGFEDDDRWFGGASDSVNATLGEAMTGPIAWAASGPEVEAALRQLGLDVAVRVSKDFAQRGAAAAAAAGALGWGRAGRGESNSSATWATFPSSKLTPGT